MGRRNRHTEPFRVVYDQCWPRTSETTHNAYYHEHFDGAQARYMKLLIDQLMETRLMEHVSFERYNEHTGKYHPMFESFSRHDWESYGLKPSK